MPKKRGVKPRGTCKHCNREGLKIIGRGLCATCFGDLTIRAAYAKYVPKHRNQPVFKSRGERFCPRCESRRRNQCESLSGVEQRAIAARSI